MHKFRTLSSSDTQNENSDECKTCFFKGSYIGPASKQLTKSLSELVYCEFGLKLKVVYATFKINCLFQLKTKIPHALCSNVVHQFRCSSDMNLAYIGMTCVPFNIMVNRRVLKFSLSNCAQSSKKTFMCSNFCTNPVLKYTQCHISTNLSNFLRLCLLYCQTLLALAPTNRRFAEKSRLSGNTGHDHTASGCKNSRTFGFSWTA